MSDAPPGVGVEYDPVGESHDGAVRFGEIVVLLPGVNVLVELELAEYLLEIGLHRLLLLDRFQPVGEVDVVPDVVGQGDEVFVAGGELHHANDVDLVQVRRILHDVPPHASLPGQRGHQLAPEKAAVEPFLQQLRNALGAVEEEVARPVEVTEALEQFFLGDAVLLDEDGGNVLAPRPGLGGRLEEILLRDESLVDEITELPRPLHRRPLPEVGEGDTHRPGDLPDRHGFLLGKDVAVLGVQELDNPHQLVVVEDRRREHLPGPEPRRLVPARVELEAGVKAAEFLFVIGVPDVGHLLRHGAVTDDRRVVARHPDPFHLLAVLVKTVDLPPLGVDSVDREALGAEHLDDPVARRQDDLFNRTGALDESHDFHELFFEGRPLFPVHFTPLQRLLQRCVRNGSCVNDSRRRAPLQKKIVPSPA